MKTKNKIYQNDIVQNALSFILRIEIFHCPNFVKMTKKYSTKYSFDVGCNHFLMTITSFFVPSSGMVICLCSFQNIKNLHIQYKLIYILNSDVTIYIGNQ